MLHGKKGFERLLWASKHILTRSLTWLFHDFHTPPPTSDPTPSSHPHQTPPPPAETTLPPLPAHHPSTHTITPLPTILPNILIPNLTPSAQLAEDEDTALALHEHLSLIALHSPRLAADDAIDPLLSRYEVPDAESAEAGNVVHVRWRGFVPAVWVSGLVVALA